jgi:putative PIN family toxin of toxin-antitoxin system
MAVCLESHEIVLSKHILSEVKGHLAAKFKLPARRSAEILQFLREHCTIVEPAEVPQEACRDPDDLPVIGTAVNAGARCLVTGDKDLLATREFQGIAILTPREFYELLTRNDPS